MSQKLRPIPHVSYLSGMSVSGFKSINKQQTIKICPLTINAGPNSAGKSSMLQTLLLIKQTLNFRSDPGPLLLSGPNLQFDSISDFVPKSSRGTNNSLFRLILNFNYDHMSWVELAFRAKESVSIAYMTFDYYGQKITFRPKMTSPEIRKILSGLPDSPATVFIKSIKNDRSLKYGIIRSRCLLDVIAFKGRSRYEIIAPGVVPGLLSPSPDSFVARRVEDLIHLPGLRGNANRFYPLFSSIDRDFPGGFEQYTATLLEKWRESGDKRLSGVRKDLRTLGLTSEIRVAKRSDTRAEILVGRMAMKPTARKESLVNIAD